MAKTRPTVQKRKKELAKLEKRQAKAAKRAQRNAAKGDRPDMDDGIDPDLVGIVPGPQPSPYADEQDAEEQEV